MKIIVRRLSIPRGDNLLSRNMWMPVCLRKLDSLVPVPVPVATAMETLFVSASDIFGENGIRIQIKCLLPVPK